MERPIQEWLRDVGLEGPIELLTTRSGSILAFGATEVIKLHPVGADRGALAARLTIAAATPQFLTPVERQPRTAPGFDASATHRPATRWPRVVTVWGEAEPPLALWSESGRLLSALHALPTPAQAPTSGAQQRAARAIASLRSSEDRRALIVLRAANRLPDPQALFAGHNLVHGDWHLGQLGRARDAETWSLLDPDDLGTGNPLVDLGRIAAFLAVGMLPEAAWLAFVDGYRAGPSSTLPPGPVWPSLDAFARWGVVVAAAGLLRDPRAADSDTLTAFLQAANSMTLVDGLTFEA